MKNYPIFPIQPETSNSALVQGIAKVVGINGDLILLEPEQTTSCGHCASSSNCHSGQESQSGIGTIASRMQARRFEVNQPNKLQPLSIGDRIVVGIKSTSLLKASITAYGIPLLAALVSGAYAQNWFHQDLITMSGMALGLLIGMLLAHLKARKLNAKGELLPRVLRLAETHETCGTV